MRQVPSQRGGASLGRSRQLLANDVSFDHLVGAGEQRGRHGQAECPSRRHIDREIELGRLLDWYIGWLCPAKYFFDIIASAPPQFRKIRSIGYQPTHFD